MRTFKEFQPTGFDAKGLGSEGREDWLVIIGTNRDADCLTRSNWEVITKDVTRYNDQGGCEILRFGHWACGWFEILIVEPNTPRARLAEKWLAALEVYPVADEYHFSDLEYIEACEVWQSCYTTKQRIEYIRDHRSYFEFHDLTDMILCVRGKYFTGDVSELLR